MGADIAPLFELTANRNLDSLWSGNIFCSTVISLSVIEILLQVLYDVRFEFNFLKLLNFSPSLDDSIHSDFVGRTLF